MKGVAKNFDFQERILGSARIRKFVVSDRGAQMFNLQCMFSGHPSEFIRPGEYVQLLIYNQLMMSDTPMEQSTNSEFIQNAHGDVLIGGLGIGLVLENLKGKVASGEVTSITIYEINKDVIDLVAPVYSDLPISFRNADILAYKPMKDEQYDTIYFDIWPTISGDNMKDIRLLHNRWKNHKRPGGWMDSWRKADCQRLNREK